MFYPGKFMKLAAYLYFSAVLLWHKKISRPGEIKYF